MKREPCLTNPMGFFTRRLTGWLGGHLHPHPFLAVPGQGCKRYIDFVSFKAPVTASAHAMLTLEMTDNRFNRGPSPLKALEPGGA